MANSSQDCTTFFAPKADVYLESEYQDASGKCILFHKKLLNSFNVDVTTMVFKP